MALNNQISSRYLIISREISSIKKINESIFLGLWCEDFNKNFAIESSKNICARPYGINKEEKDSDFKKAREIELRLLHNLMLVMNYIHGVNKDSRYWNIIIGHWLRRYIEVIINRYGTISQCLSENDISDIEIIRFDESKLIRNNSIDSIWDYSNEYWNMAVFSKIIELIKPQNINLMYVSKDIEINKKFKKNSLKKYIKTLLKNIQKIINLIQRKDRPLIINTYLSNLDELKLKYIEGCFPSINLINSETCNKPYSSTLRENASEKLCELYKINSKFEEILIILLFKLIPKCYIEGFIDNQKIAKKLPWPKNPKYIFTSNSFDTDEIFKIWAAEKVSEGSKYIIGQHGANYGTSRYMNPSIEELCSDKFITWGWEGNLIQHTKGFLFKNFYIKKQKKIYLILVQLHPSQRCTTWDDYFEYSIYFNNQIKFCKELTNEVRQNLIVRLHNDTKKMDWLTIEKWKSYDDTIKIDNGTKSIKYLIKNSKLVVFSYDSTGLLELISGGIPCMAFWEGKLDHLREEVIPVYNLLVDVGILHFSPISISSKINEVWPDIDDWWISGEVSDARDQFCKQFINKSKKIYLDMYHILNN